jgi:WD40 repeat protein
MREKTTRWLIAVLLICGMIGSGAVAFAAEGKPEIFMPLGHSNSVNSVAFSPDGRYALSGSKDNTMKLWEIASGSEIRTFTGHSSSVYSVAFSPDGRYALSLSGDSTMKLWDLASGREMKTIKGHLGWIRALSTAP